MNRKRSRPIIVITRPKNQSDGFDLALQKNGFATFHLPVIEIKPRPPDEEIARGIERLKAGEFGWLVFTSANAVRGLSAMQIKQLPPQLKIAVIGEKTGLILAKYFGRAADLSPQDFISESLAAELLKYDLSSERILIARGDKSRGVVAASLKDRCREVAELVLYENISCDAEPRKIELLESLSRDGLVFTFYSPSAVEATCRVLKGREQLLSGSEIVTIGPVTSNEVRKSGFTVAIEVSEHSEEAMLEAICRSYQDRN